MTATLAPTAQVRPRITYFWWLREARAITKPAAAAPSYVPADADYIPSGTADLWRRCAPRPLR